MRKLSLNLVKGNEKLAQDVISNSGIVLMSKGSILKKEYISKLYELGIQSLYIEDELARGINVDEIIEMQIKNQCESTVRKTLEKFTYAGNAQLEQLTKVAEEIIIDILEEPEVMFNISGVRQKSESTYSHSINVCAMSVLIAIKMKLPKVKIRDIAVGSLLHDIGYNYISTDYSEVPVFNLKPDELKEIKKHVVYGYSAVENEEWLSAVAKDIILSHHELINGSGYPFHLNGDKIKVGSKIVAVCDEFDRRVYGSYTKKMKVHEVIDYILSQSGIKFDFKVVKMFYESVAAYPNGTTVITNEGDLGIVLRQNKKCPTRPVIRIFRDRYGNECEEWVERNLTEDLTLFIEDTVE